MADTYEVERSHRIDAPAQAVRERIVDLRRWTSWSPWEDLDPDQERTYGGPESGVGAWYAWDGDRNAGKGRMEILEVDDGSVRIDLQFLKPFRSHGNTIFEFEPDGDGTLVTWRLIGANTGLTKVMGWFTSMDRMVGPDLEKGLAALEVDTRSTDG